MSPLSRLPLLVVEDEPAIGRALVRQLKTQGHGVVWVASVAEADQLDQDFSAAVVDLNLPDGSGLTIADDLYARGQVDVVVFFSATLDEQEIAEAKKRGQFIAKSEGVDAVKLALATLHRRAPGSAPPKSRTRPSNPFLDVDEVRSSSDNH